MSSPWINFVWQSGDHSETKSLADTVLQGFTAAHIGNNCLSASSKRINPDDFVDSDDISGDPYLASASIGCCATFLTVG